MIIWAVLLESLLCYLSFLDELERLTHKIEYSLCANAIVYIEVFWINNQLSIRCKEGVCGESVVFVPSIYVSLDHCK